MAYSDCERACASSDPRSSRTIFRNLETGIETACHLKLHSLNSA